MLNVTHNKAKNGNTYLNARPADIKPLPEGMDVPDQMNDSQFLWFSAEYDVEWVPNEKDASKPDDKVIKSVSNVEMF